MPSVWPILMPKILPSPSATRSAAPTEIEGEKIVFAPGRAAHALEELAPVEDADPVEEHGQPGERDRADDLRLRGEGADREPDEQHGADAEREAADVDLADEIAEADREEEREDRLGA